MQLFRYTFVGGLAFILDFGTLIGLTEIAGIPYLISAAISFMLGLGANYVMSILWVFSKRSVESPRVEFLIFAGIGLVALALNEAILWFLTEKVGIHYAASKVASAVLVYLFNFGARKLALFK